MNRRCTRVPPLLGLACMIASAAAPACGGPKLNTLAPGVYADAGAAGAAEAGSAGAAEAGAAEAGSPEASGAAAGQGSGGEAGAN
ncbi:MAG: hypothetical protein ABI548_11945 [Polyangiaceae bacterium]